MLRREALCRGAEEEAGNMSRGESKILAAYCPPPLCKILFAG